MLSLGLRAEEFSHMPCLGGRNKDRLGGGPPWGGGGLGRATWASAIAASLPSALDSMQELYEEMKLVAFDLQDNNRIIEGYGAAMRGSWVLKPPLPQGHKVSVPDPTGVITVVHFPNSHARALAFSIGELPSS